MWQQQWSEIMSGEQSDSGERMELGFYPDERQRKISKCSQFQNNRKKSSSNPCLGFLKASKY